MNWSMAMLFVSFIFWCIPRKHEGQFSLYFSVQYSMVRLYYVFFRSRKIFLNVLFWQLLNIPVTVSSLRYFIVCVILTSPIKRNISSLTFQGIAAWRKRTKTELLKPTSVGLFFLELLSKFFPRHTTPQQHLLLTLLHWLLFSWVKNYFHLLECHSYIMFFLRYHP